MIFAVVNESSHVSSSQANAIAIALHRQLKGDVAAVWGDAGSTAVHVESAEGLHEGLFPILLVDSDSDVPDAYGWHERGCAVVVVELILAETGAGVLSGPVSVSSVVSHEGVETEGDPGADEWIDMPDGRETPRERCDACQDGSYTIDVHGVAVSVSNFLRPSWFDPGGKAPFDKLGALRAPFTRTPGGYMVVRTPGEATELYGDLPRHRGEHLHARVVRRLGQVGQARVPRSSDPNREVRCVTCNAQLIETMREAHARAAGHPA